MICNRAQVLGDVGGDLAFRSGYPEAKGVFLREDELAGGGWQGGGRGFLFSEFPALIQKPERLGQPPVVLERSGKDWLFSNHPRTR